jgi:Raf kinase inhibitor-like YbhB/YbcL family protein
MREAMRITSPAFKNGDRIPPQFTCDGDDVNPELRIDAVPAATKSLALLVDDPDSPSGNWLHWSVWNISPDTRVIKEDDVPQGAREGETDFSEVEYGGPCPSYGEHVYRFGIYALDIVLETPAGASRPTLEKALEGHILSSAFLTGRYQRVKKEARVSKAVKVTAKATAR